ncbi:MAG TPA: pitrilysin family protein [Micromonosporaceae bacterium]|nr:pitrilysin family protein [Micromonosporaceae bacterium]
MTVAVPDLRPASALTVPRTVERTLANGLTVLAIQRSAIPLVELRLCVPFGAAKLRTSYLASSSLLSQTLFSGTSTMSTVDIAAQLQSLGGALGAGVDPDRLMVSGNALASGLDRMLAILAEVLTDAAYPEEEVDTERERLAERIQIAQSQPAHLARVALLRRRYGGHPYSVQTPTVPQVHAVTPAALRALHADRIHPTGAQLVLVGDVDAERALDAAERALAGWDGPGKEDAVPPVPQPRLGPVTLVDRPGSVQSSLRLTLPAVERRHPDHAALQLANLVFGGYFSSRWVENIREDKGYTYSPQSFIEHSQGGSSLVLSTDVATEVTGPALLETLYELGRIATSPPGAQELEQARQYAAGTLQLGMSTQAGLANLASTYAAFGLRLEYLVEHAARLAAATVEDVAAAGMRYLAPARALTVVLGDADRMEAALTTLAPVERTTVDEVLAA